jgi:glycosyltransferase involved in cell wall biosynthesis
VIRHERSLGVAQARNAGIFAARGAWIAFLDDDDLWAPRKLRRQIDVATESGRAWVYSASAALDEQRRFLFSLEPPEPGQITRSLLRWNELWGGCSNVVVRSDVARELGGFDEKLFQLADWDLWIRLALKKRAAGVRDVLLGCVMHSRSMLATDERNVFLEFDYLTGKHREASRAFGIDFDAARFNRWVAFGHRAAGRRLPAARTYVRGSVRHRDVGALPRAVAALLGERSFAAWRGFVPDAARYLAVEPEMLTWLTEYPPPARARATT